MFKESLLHVIVKCAQDLLFLQQKDLSPEAQHTELLKNLWWDRMFFEAAMARTTVSISRLAGVRDARFHQA